MEDQISWKLLLLSEEFSLRRKSNKEGTSLFFYILAEKLPLENPLLTDIKSEEIGKKIQVYRIQIKITRKIQLYCTWRFISKWQNLDVEKSSYLANFDLIFKLYFCKYFRNQLLKHPNYLEFEFFLDMWKLFYRSQASCSIIDDQNSMKCARCNTYAFYIWQCLFIRATAKLNREENDYEQKKYCDIKVNRKFATYQS